MPDWLKFPIVLIIVTVISAISLAALHNVTEPIKKRLEAETKKEALAIVLPDAAEFKEVTGQTDGAEFTYLVGTGSDGEIVGYVTDGSAPGYSSNIRVMVGVDREYNVVAIKVLSQKETPGLGDKIEEVLSKKTIVGLLSGEKYDEKGLRPWFQIQFDGKSVPLVVGKAGGDMEVITGATTTSRIEVITGATISSRAVCNAVTSAVTNLTSATHSKHRGPIPSRP